MNNLNNTQSMKPTTSKWTKVASSVFHLFIYVAILTVVSTTLASGQCDGINLACNNGINISTNENCLAEVTLDIIMEGDPAGFTDSDFVITLKKEDGSVHATASGDQVITVGDDEVGITFKACATLVQCGITCWGYITIEDKVGPKFLNCNGNAEFGLEPVEIPCGDGFNVSYPPLASTCDMDNTTITHNDVSLGVTCVGQYSGEIIRTWTALDASGNGSQCKQQLFVTKFDVNDVVFPDDYLFEIDAADCDNIPSIEPSSTGEPTGLECPNIMFFYTDIGAETCGKQVKLIRDWFVVDWCSGESVSEGQVIKVRDVSPPVSVCPLDREIRGNIYRRSSTGGSSFDTLYVPSFTQSCSAQFTLDPLAIIDSLTAPEFVFDCSLPLSLEVSYKTAEPGVDPSTVPFNEIAQGADGLYPIPGLIDDVTWVRYCFTDACGNGDVLQSDPNVPSADFVNCCFFEIRVSDNNPPNAICEGFTKVPVGAGGSTEVPAKTFDDHSFDPCGSIMTFEARRENAGCGSNNFYGPTVHFCCEDIGDTINVILKVTDSEGNFSECPTRVCVTDDFVPQFDCPDDITIDCVDDYTNLDTATGTIGCSSNYTIGNGLYDLSQYNTSCNTGIITRNIQIKDLDGNVINTCSQKITVLPMGDSANLTPGDYVFPDDVMIDQCGTNTSIHPDQTGYPTTSQDYQCINIGISYEDGPPVQSNNDGVCYTILRKWTVVDWCRYETNNPNSFSLTGTQTIIIKNSGAPTLECPDMLMVSTDSVNCVGFINLDVALTDNCVGSRLSWALDANSDGTVDATGTGSASGEYPVGDHSITYNVTNECGGGTASCTFPFSIKGNRPPLPICLATISWTLNQDGEAVVWASDFDLKSEGGCDGMDSLTFSFVSPDDAGFPQTSRSFSCADIPNGGSEMIILQIYIVDESGVYEACTVILDLQDTNDVCPDVGSLVTSLSGSVMTEQAHAMENVMVQLDDMTNVNSTMDMTGSSGSYAFNSVDYYNAYSIYPEHDVDHLNGISTIDLIQIQRHILGIQELDSPYKVIAADVNKDNQVNAIDLVELRKLILGIYTELPQNDSWVFVSEGYGFSDPMQPWGYDNSIDIQSLYSANNNADFIAVKVGDVNSDAIVALESDNLTNRNAPFYFSGANATFSAGDLVAVPFRAEDAAQLSGLQLTMKFDHEALLFQGIDKGVINLTEANFALLNDPMGTLTFSYSEIDGFDLKNGDELFTIYFEAKQDGVLDDMIALSDQIAKSEVYLGNSESRAMEYVIRGNVEQSNELELFQNQPNPFSESTRISFFTPADQEITLKVFDSTGKMIFTRGNSFSKGMNEFTIESDDLPAHGILIYQIETDNASLTNKMILVR